MRAAQRRVQTGDLAAAAAHQRGRLARRPAPPARRPAPRPGRRSRSRSGRGRSGRRRAGVSPAGSRPGMCSAVGDHAAVAERVDQRGSAVALERPAPRPRRAATAARPSLAASRASSCGSAGQLGQRRLAPGQLGALDAGAGSAPGIDLLQLVDALQQGAELELAEQLLHAGAVGRVGHQRGEVDVDARASRSMVASVFDSRRRRRRGRAATRAASRPSTSSSAGVDALEAAELDEQVGGGLLADARDAGDVVGACRP